MTPGWPRLAAAHSPAPEGTARGRWRSRDEDGEVRSGTFAYRARHDGTFAVDDGRHDWAVVDDDGRPVTALSPRDLWREHDYRRGDDYHRAAGPVTEVEHDGRRAWQVRLAPPPHKSGLLTLVVDDVTGRLLRMANDDHDYWVEVLDLELGVHLDDAVFAAAREAAAQQSRQRGLYDLLPTWPPTPRWFPWRRTWADAQDRREVPGLVGWGTVGRAPLGQEAPVTDFVSSDQVVRLDHAGWSWAVALDGIDEASARAVVEQVVDDPDA